MENQLNHLIFYDGECGLCDRAVQVVLKADKHNQFAFAPLNGTTALHFLQKLPPELKNADSLILVEDYQSADPQIYLRSKAVFHICKILGGVWTFPGWLSYLPPDLFDWAYRLVAKYRHRLFPQNQCIVPPSKKSNQFLP
jgi:predicted DCC family thiol-disulfide oxidoreductase YuxK